MKEIPIIINCRDRVTPLRQLVAWLEDAGHERIVLLDNDSTYEPLLDYYKQTPHSVVKLRRNLGARALWHSQKAPKEPFVYTDPDIVPIEDCPYDAVEYLDELRRRHHMPKAGLGLYLHDLPDDFDEHILWWERQLISQSAYAHQLEPGVYASKVDTTFAVYAPTAPWYTLRGIRTLFPYQARHTSWYVQNTPTEEDQYYLARAKHGPGGSSWAQIVATGKYG